MRNARQATFLKSLWLECRLNPADFRLHLLRLFKKLYHFPLVAGANIFVFFLKDMAEMQAIYAWRAAAGALSEGKSLTQARGAGGGVRDTCLAARSALADIKEGNLRHWEKINFATVQVSSFDWPIN
jgi:hypothetical protein